MAVPRLAKGGLVGSATIAMIGERGREAVLPLERNTEWMDTLAAKTTDAMGTIHSANSEPATVILEVDRREFGRATVDLGDSERQRRGVRIQARSVLAGYTVDGR